MIYKHLHKTLTRNQKNLPGVVKTKNYNKEKID